MHILQHHLIAADSINWNSGPYLDVEAPWGSLLDVTNEHGKSPKTTLASKSQNI